MPEVAAGVENLSVTFGRGEATVPILSGLTSQFYPGEVTLLLGVSGSGKTTLLSVMGCLRRPESGRVIVMDQDVTNFGHSDLLRVRQRSIGFVFQFFRLFRSLSALENVRLGFELGGSRNYNSAIPAKQALEAVGLESKATRRPDQLSGGERQRVALARAFVKEPQVLLADEPTAALDLGSGKLVANLIRDLAKRRNIAAIVATHDARLIPIADRIVEMSDGQIVRDERTPR